MDEIFASISQWFRDKTTSPLYGTYLASLIGWNWRFFYTLFFQDQTSLSIAKIEYIEQKFLLDGALFHAAEFFVPPVIFTFLIIKYLPIATNWAYGIKTDFYFRRKVFFDQKKIEYEEGRKQNLGKLEEITTQQATSRRQIEKNLTDEDRWSLEYEEFRTKPNSKKFKQIIDAVYKFEGWIKFNAFRVDSDILADSHSRDLITFTNETNSRIELTEKGKFFVKKHLEDVPEISQLPF